MTKKIDITTSASINKDIVGPEKIEEALMQISACKHVRLTVDFDKETGNVNIEIIRSNEPTKKRTLLPGDSLNFKHEFNIDMTRVVRGDHPFPINIKYKGEKYLLNRTKNDKLLLTK